MRLSNVAEELNCHGFPDIAKTPNRCIKAIWVVAVIISIGAMCFYIASTVFEYLEYPIASVISLRLSQVGLEFPTVYVCPAEEDMIDYTGMDAFTKHRLQNFSITGIKKEKPEPKRPKMGRIVKDMGNGVMMLDWGPLPTTTTPRPPGAGEPCQPFYSHSGRCLSCCDNRENKPLSILEMGRGFLELAKSSSSSGFGGNSLVCLPSVVYDKKTGDYTCFCGCPYSHLQKMYENETYKELQMRVGMKLKNFMVECAFDGREFPCNQTTKEVIDSNGGKCFLVSLAGKQTKIDKGLSIVLKNGEKQHSPDARRVLTAGAWLRVDENFDPFSVKKVRLLGGGSTVKIALKKSKVHLLNSPHSKDPQYCIDKPPEYRVYIVQYSKESCEHDCFQQRVFNSCKCILPVDETYLREDMRGTRLCSNTSMTVCVVVVHRKLASEAALNRRSEDAGEASSNVNQSESTKPGNAYLQCLSQCGQQCISTSIETSVTYGTMVGENLAEKETVVDLAFESMNVLELHQTYAVTVVSMVSHFGGHMGIWLGASALTLVQLMVLFMKACMT